ncbi:zf-HC2 domain-containing protein [Teredinibacter haidensis]|uniref:zf-HC2 domain-containing protein n=1 Tax=Teredinibacter haidensis TaxID=2731755 RepID=UPI0009490D05|nr:zf-HC2 domain-containing protein [Teredinibacter haidensis]
MRCNQVQQFVDDYFDTGLPGYDHAAFERHLQNCSRCWSVYEAHLFYLDKMRSLRTVKSNPDELAAVLNRAKIQLNDHRSGRNQRNLFARGFIAIVLLLGIGLLGFEWFYSKAPVEPRVIASVTDDAPRLKDVSVVISVPENLDGTRIVLQLPDGIRIQGSNQASVSWSEDLVKGVNELVLPLSVSSGVDLGRKHEIDATLIYKNKQKKFHLKVDLDKTEDLNRADVLRGSSGFQAT